jgi:uncharacterized protein YndB with AHSA1/START domain
MPTLHSEVVIEAPAELIWGIIVDVARYPEWNPFNVRATSTLEIGAPIRMRVGMMGGLFGKWPGGWFQSQVEYIRANVPGEKICWGADMALLAHGAHSGVRITRYQMLCRVARA